VRERKIQAEYGAVNADQLLDQAIKALAAEELRRDLAAAGDSAKQTQRSLNELITAVRRLDTQLRDLEAQPEPFTIQEEPDFVFGTD
jgi:hypothetical protein